jgi:uridine kinase
VSLPAAAPTLVALTGGSGSAKTTVAMALVQALLPLRAAVLSEDDYYRDFGADPAFDPANTNFDHVDARDHGLLIAHLDALQRGEPVSHPLYDFARHARRNETQEIPPCDVLILEGLHLLHDPALRQRFHLTVYLHVPDDVRLGRRLLRDIKERGRDPDEVVGRYLSTVRPMHYAFTEPARETADLVIDVWRDHAPVPTGETVALLVKHIQSKVMT